MADLAGIDFCYTSGTTGDKAGVMLHFKRGGWLCVANTILASLAAA